MKQVAISYSLFGDWAKYIVPLMESIKQINNYNIKLSFSIVNLVYVDDLVPDYIIQELTNMGAVVRRARLPADSLFQGMTARYFASRLEIFDAVIIRDADSILSIKELKLIQHFLSSDYDFYTIRDSSSHVMPIMGGLFGLKKAIYNDFFRLFISNYRKYMCGEYGADQVFLADKIYTYFRKKMLVYSSYGVFPHENVKKIERTTEGFIGGYYDDSKLGCSEESVFTLYPFILAKFFRYRLLGKVRFPGWCCVNYVN